MNVKMTPIDYHGASSYWLKSDRVELYLTTQGGHLGPVSYKLKHRWAMPLTVPPWRPDEVHSGCPPVLALMRGNFFCLPVGDDGSGQVLHGSAANEVWKLRHSSLLSLSLEQNLTPGPGRIVKTIRLEAGQRALYLEHLLEGFSGPHCFGVETVLDFSTLTEPGHFNSGPFALGQVKPGDFTGSSRGEFSSLEPGAIFEDLAKVPLAGGGETDLRRFPARRGFDDLVMLLKAPSEGLAWCAATFDGYVWISLKDARSLPGTLLSFFNGGCLSSPWSGGYLGRLGVGEVCSHFKDGLPASLHNPLQDKGFATCHELRPDTPLAVRTIHAVHPVPKDFGKVCSVEAQASGQQIIITGDNGQSFSVAVNLSFLQKKTDLPAFMT